MKGPSLRIVAGRFGGRRVRVPPGARPTEGRVREALFSRWGRRVEGATVLDAFAGSGAVGIEALSRGARRAVFVESSARGVAALRTNLDELGVGEEATVVRATLPDVRRLEGERFDLLFADPPYAWREAPDLLVALRGLAAPDAELVLEHASETEPPESAGGWERVAVRAYAGSSLAFYG